MNAMAMARETVKLIPCDVCGVHKVAVTDPAAMVGETFLACDVCAGEGEDESADTLPRISVAPPLEVWADVCLVCGEPGELDAENTCSDRCRDNHRRLVAVEHAIDQDLSDRVSEVFS